MTIATKDENLGVLAARVPLRSGGSLQNTLSKTARQRLTQLRAAPTDVW